jgi:hypothetical protein
MDAYFKTLWTDEYGSFTLDEVISPTGLPKVLSRENLYARLHSKSVWRILFSAEGPKSTIKSCVCRIITSLTTWELNGVGAAGMKAIFSGHSSLGGWGKSSRKPDASVLGSPRLLIICHSGHQSPGSSLLNPFKCSSADPINCWLGIVGPIVAILVLGAWETHNFAAIWYIFLTLDTSRSWTLVIRKLFLYAACHCRQDPSCISVYPVDQVKFV